MNSNEKFKITLILSMFSFNVKTFMGILYSKLHIIFLFIVQTLLDSSISMCYPLHTNGMFLQKFSEEVIMARNKHPEETVNLILDTAYRLFMQKGYEHTSIQDIIDQLGGLSKGAIYHHFKSKEEILIAVTDRLSAQSNAQLAAIRDRKGLTGAEKLKMLFKESVTNPMQNELFTAAPNFGDNPQLLFMILDGSLNDSAPNYIQPIIEQGIADGTIQTEHPEEFSEMLMLLANFWLNPMIFGDSAEKTHNKFKVFQQLLDGIGLHVVDGDMLHRMEELSAIYQEHR